MFELNDILKSKNVAAMFEDLQDGKRDLQTIGRLILEGADIDQRSGESWRKSIDEAMDIAKQVMNKKSFPWDGAANIKYPLITQAAINFASRTYPELIPNDNIVETVVQGSDPNDAKYQRGQRVSDCLSYQCVSSPDWKEHIDRLLHILPVVGTVFTKIYYNEIEKRNCVELCPPDQIIINHETTSSLKCARRVTHIINMSMNDIKSYQRAGLYSDASLELMRPDDADPDDYDFDIELYEQHCWLDLDGDGYKEPYVVTIHPKTMTVFRIVNRIKPKSIKKNSDGEIIKLEAIQYFQDYHFIRSPDGGYYSMGFGQLLLPLNKAINSLMNQLIDAGTVSVTQGGFLGRGLRLKGGELRFKPFEWKVLDAASGTDLKQNVFPFPVREPSQTLFSLLSLLINIGKELTAATDVLNGNMPATNVAQGTLNGLRQEGKTVLKAINLRLYDSMTESFKKLYELNYYYLSDKEYQSIIGVDGIKVKEDFALENNNVRPVADPDLSTMEQRLHKGGVLAQMSMNPQTGIDPRAVSQYILSSMQFDKNDLERFMPPPQPMPPPPEVIKAQAEAQLAQAKIQEMQLNAQIKAGQAPLDAEKLQKDIAWIDAQMQESASRAWKTMKDAAHNDQKILITGSKMQQQEALKQLQDQHKQLKDQVDALLQNKALDIKAQDVAMKHAVALEKIKQDGESNEGSDSGQV